MKGLYVAGFVLLMSISLIGGCSESKPTKQVHTVEWFMEPGNKGALEETLKECRNNPGQLKDDPNCINAASAQNKIFADKPAPTNW